MSDELLRAADTWRDNPPLPSMCGHFSVNDIIAIQGLIGRLAARVRELEAERDDYKAQAREYWDIGLRRERENEALRALLVDARDSIACWGSYLCEYFQKEYGLGDDLARIDAALKDRHE